MMSNRQRDAYAVNERPTFVYVMTSNGRVKIGVATDTEKRLKQLQQANPSIVRLAHARQFSTRKSALHAEQALHRRYKDKRLVGEWFEVPARFVIAAVDKAEDRQIHAQGWHPDMPPEIAASDSALERWQWHRENDLTYGS